MVLIQVALRVVVVQVVTQHPLLLTRLTLGGTEALALLSETLTEAGSSCDLKRFRDFPLPEPSSKRASLQEVRIMGYSYASCRSVYERLWEASVQAPNVDPMLLKVKRIRKKGSDRMIRPAVFSIVGLDAHDPVFVAELSRVMSRYSAIVTQLPYPIRRTHARPSLRHNPASTRSRMITGGTLHVYTLLFIRQEYRKEDY